MWMKHIKMCVGAVGFGFSLVGIFLVYAVTTKHLTLTEFISEAVSTWEDIKTNIYGGE